MYLCDNCSLAISLRRSTTRPTASVFQWTCGKPRQVHGYSISGGSPEKRGVAAVTRAQSGLVARFNLRNAFLGQLARTLASPGSLSSFFPPQHRRSFNPPFASVLTSPAGPVPITIFLLWPRFALFSFNHSFRPLAEAFSDADCHFAVFASSCHLRQDGGQEETRVRRGRGGRTADQATSS